MLINQFSSFSSFNQKSHVYQNIKHYVRGEVPCQGFLDKIVLTNSSQRYRTPLIFLLFTTCFNVRPSIFVTYFRPDLSYSVQRHENPESPGRAVKADRSWVRFLRELKTFFRMLDGCGRITSCVTLSHE